MDLATVVEWILGGLTMAMILGALAVHNGECELDKDELTSRED